jgi:hypothetical protein
LANDGGIRRGVAFDIISVYANAPRLSQPI